MNPDRLVFSSLVNEVKACQEMRKISFTPENVIQVEMK